jgi:histidinol-phosphate aminotransferase
LPGFIADRIVESLKEANRYPHPDLVESFRAAAARYNGVDPANIYPAPGGDGALRQVIYNLTDPGDSVLINNPSYSMYRVYCSTHGLNMLQVNLIEGQEWWHENFREFLELSKRADMVLLDDPNNPTGSPMLGGKEDTISQLASTTKGFVMVDEAYYEFSAYTVSKMIREFPNLIVLRTMSKAFSLAGLRVGYLIANEEVVDALMKASTPFDIALPGLVAGIEALNRPDYAFRNVSEIRKNREYLISSLRSLGLKVYNSLTNFVLVKTQRDIISPLLSAGVAIRNPMKGFYRISVGTKEQCDTVIRVLGESIEDRHPQ